MTEAYKTNWISTVGKNINVIEAQVAECVGVKYAVALSAGTAALHLATKLAGEKLYGQTRPNKGTLEGHTVFASDMTFDVSINPIAYEDGEAVFIETDQTPGIWIRLLWKKHLSFIRIPNLLSLPISTGHRGK